MKNLIVYYEGSPELKVQLEDIARPTYGDDEVLIKVVVAGSNPKDFKHPIMFKNKLNQGDDVGGVIEAVGSKVRNFRPGDRVAGFHSMDTPRGTYAEYTVCPANTVWHIPDSMSFEEAATMPLAAFTAAVGLYRNLGLPLPFDRTDEEAAPEKVALIVNGASTAVGAFAVKLAKLNPSISPIIGIAGGSANYAKEIGCDAVVDYRSDDVAGQIGKALNGAQSRFVLDASNNEASVKYLVPNMAQPSGRYTWVTLMGAEKAVLEQAGVWHGRIWVGSVHETTLTGEGTGQLGIGEEASPTGGKLFGAVMSRLFEWASAEGRFSGQPYKVVDGGLDGVLGALNELKDRKGGNAKFVYRIADTPGL